MVFVSYSRSEAPFVDALTTKLERRGFDVWLDYRDMEPGGDWDNQLQREIANADAVLLVVSRRSIKSANVGRELRQASCSGRRIVLAIVEAVPLPALEHECPWAKPTQLRACPWVDMRGNLDTAVNKLCSVLRGESGMERTAAPPEAGFRAPGAVWSTAALAVPVALLSLAALWTVVVPLILVPLPYRVLRRDFNYAAVRTALIASPAAAAFLRTYAADTFGEGSTEVNVADAIQLSSMLLSLMLYLAIRSRWVRRWMKPAAARPKSSRRVKHREALKRETSSQTFAIDSAGDDVGYDRQLRKVLIDHGHREFAAMIVQEHETTTRQRSGDHPITEMPRPDVTLYLVSAFHDTDEIPEDRLVLPTLIQDPDDELPARLKRTQWIDLRPGARRRQLKNIARLLDKPKLLLRTIGVAPPHDQLVLPRGVFALYLCLWAAILASLSAVWFALIAQVRYGEGDVLMGAASFIVLAAVVATLGWRAKKVLLERRRGTQLGWLVAAISIGLLGLLFVTGLAEDDDPALTLAEAAGNAVFIPAPALPLIWGLYANSIVRWVPVARSPLPKWADQWPRMSRLLAMTFVITVFGPWGPLNIADGLTFE